MKVSESGAVLGHENRRQTLLIARSVCSKVLQALVRPEYQDIALCVGDGHAALAG
jgi:hypothetical protein